MYSIVLMAAVSGGPSTSAADVAPPVVVAPAAPVVVAGSGCCGGCTGYATSYGCCGGYSYGCCGGKHGGGFLGHRRGCCGGGGFLGHKHSCHGCCGGYAYSCSGCYGSGWGSCYGSGYGAYSYGCYGSCYGGYGSYSYPVYGGAPAVVVPTAPAAPMTPTAPAPTPEKKKTGSDTGASLKFRLPAEAALYVDGTRVGGEGTERAFFTPPLDAGQKFFYDVRAEVVVDGKTVTEEKRVVVESGANLTESFGKLFAAAARPTTVAGK